MARVRPAPWTLSKLAGGRSYAGLPAQSRVDDYSRFISKVSAARQPSAIRALMPLLKVPGMISLGGGLPNPSTFPFQSIKVTTVAGATFDLCGASLTEALQYSPTAGLPSLLQHLDTLQAHFHGVRQVPNGALVTTGSQDALSKAFEMVLDPGDALLVEAPTYSGSLAFLRPLGARLVGIDTDAEGLVPASLLATLKTWNSNFPGIELPKVLYCIPTGSNPTGGSLNIERRREVYRIAQQYNLLILEDDPYYYLQFAPRRDHPPSMLALDTDGRVLRFDSLSKVLSAGLRLGWATGPAPLVERLQLHMQSTSLHTSGLSQAVAAGLFDSWAAAPGGFLAGWSAHVDSITAVYRQRRDAFLSSANRHLTGLATWNSPSAGMFVWLRLTGLADTGPFVRTALARDAKVLFVPGAEFFPDSSRPTSFIRASFSTASEADMDEALRRLAHALRTAAR
jgi:kynurenine/2-aminoadipate aminotransferase